MSKKSRVFLTLGLIVLLSSLSINVKAQGQDGNFKWIGNDPSTVIANTTNQDMNKVYLYNVGTGKYLNVGDVWGTAINAYNVGLELELNSVGTDTYTIQGALTTTDGKFLGFPYVKSGEDNTDQQSSWDRIFCDRTINNANVKWIIKPASSYSPTNKTYTLYCDNSIVPTDSNHYVQPAIVKGNRYLVVKPVVSSSNRILYDYLTADDPLLAGNKNGEWKLVTLDDLKKAFKAQFASAEAPADATFLMSDPDFVRSHKGIEKWTVTGFQATPQMAGGKNIYAFNVDSPNTYYVGVGQFNGWPDKYTRLYGSYWNASIRNLGNNAQANGTVSQKVTTLKKGWYRVSCDGFFSPDTGSGMKASLFANVDNTTDGRSNVSAMLNVFGNGFTYAEGDLTKTYQTADANAGTESPYVKAANLFEKGSYNNSILVYVPADNDKLNVGIKVEGSNKPLDWTVFDNFQLKYCGDNDMILDEDATSLSYLSKQNLNPNSAYTLILKRTLKPGQWASITLPVSLTAAQFKTAFGDQAKLSTFVGQDPALVSRLKFASVDLSKDNDVVLEANKLYIMKAVRGATVENGKYEKTLSDNSKYEVNAPYYVINNVVLPNVPSPTFKENAKSTTTTSNDIQFCGTHIWQNTPYVPAQSYVLSGKNGQWYHTASKLSIKGFRCWVATNVNSTTPAKSLTFVVDGEDIGGSVNGIEGLEVATEHISTKTPVYNLQGQKVAENDSQLNTLPAGIYIVNNKKVFVK